MLAAGSSFLTSAVFWTAAGVVVAAVVGLAPLASGTSWRYIGLQKLLNRERSFYEDCKGYRPKSERLDPAEDLAESYFGAVDAGLGGIGLLSRTQHHEAKSKLQELILNLQRTHQTLVNALEPFASQDAKAFIKNWPQEESKLNSIYLGGGIISEAHTHCSEVESVVWELCSRNDLQNTPGLSQIRDLGYSVVVQDRDVIIPVMRLFEFNRDVAVAR